MLTIRELIDTLPQHGQVEWIGVRSARDAAVDVLREVSAVADHGLEGDHYAKVGGKRQVTLIQSEHLIAIASMMGIEVVEPRTVRRNIVIRGINLLALKDKEFFVGDVKLTYGALCCPCSHMETQLGPGGYNAMRGHGGITAQVLTSGTIRIGDSVRMAAPQ